MRGRSPAVAQHAEALRAARKVEHDLAIALGVLRIIVSELRPSAAAARVMTRSTDLSYEDASRLLDRLVADPAGTLPEVEDHLYRATHARARHATTGPSTRRRGDTARRRVTPRRDLVAAVRSVDTALVRAHHTAFLLALDLSDVLGTARDLRRDLQARRFVDASMPTRTARLALEIALVFAEREDLVDFLSTTPVQLARRKAVERVRQRAGVATSELAALVTRPTPALGVGPLRRALGRGSLSTHPARPARLPAAPRHLLAVAVAVAPSRSRARYAEEWAAELDRVHPGQRTGHLLGLLRGAADLRSTQRWADGTTRARRTEMTDRRPEPTPGDPSRRRRGTLAAVGLGSAGLGAVGTALGGPGSLHLVGILPVLVGVAALLTVLFVAALSVAASRRIGADVVLHELLSWSLALLGRERPWVFDPAVRGVDPAPPRAPDPDAEPPP